MSRLIEYLAGFFDGEGSISLHSVSRSIKIQVGQVDKRPLELYAQVFGGAVLFHKITSGLLPFYQYNARSNSGKILSSLYPYLLVKQEKAQVALKRLGLPVPASSKIVSTAYCAGFFDAEGSVVVYMVGNHVRPRIEAKQVNLYPLQVLKDMYNGYITESVTREGNLIFRWQLKQLDIASFCNDIIPYTIVKQKQLKLMKRLVAIKSYRMDVRRSEKMEERLALAVEIKLLNSCVDLRAEVEDMFAD